MKKLYPVLIMLLLVAVNVTPANAANKTTLLTKAFQKYLSDGDINYTKSLSDSKALYEPQISSAKNKLLAAQSQFAKSNQVTILKSTKYSAISSESIGIDAVNCPSTNPDCKGVLKANEFKAGEIATVYSLIGGDEAFLTNFNAQLNLGILQTVDSEIKNGLISLNNPTAYNNSVSEMRNQYQNILTLTRQYGFAKTDAETELQDVQSMESAISSAILSSKRAALNSSTFEKAFVTSFKFEYNAKRLDELARSPWTYISSLKALRDAVSVTKQSELADSISSRYSFKAASNLNATYANLFLSEQNFKSSFQLVASIYKNATGATITSK